MRSAVRFHSRRLFWSTMMRPHLSRIISAALVLTVGIAFAQRATAQSAANPPATLHDGSHDFDFELGTWHAHLRYLKHRLAGSNEWDELDGTVVTKPFMDGKGNITEMDVLSPTTHRHIQNIAVRLYNVSSRQWSIYGAGPDDGVFDPPQIGQFEGNRGEFYATDKYQGRAVFIRFVWQNLSPTHTHFEQAFSVDGGKTWEVNWIYDGTRQPPSASH
jgi:hypothetical protein